MSITPVEEDEGREDRNQSRDRRSGVRARLQSWLASVGQRIRVAVEQFARTTSQSETTDSTDREAGQIRVGGQRRLEGERRTSTSRDRAKQLPHRGNLPGSADIDAKQEGDTLRVYNPKLDGAYITSDTWEEVEQ